MPRPERPLAEGTPLLEFAQGLRLLRDGTGLTYRELARRTGFSAATLSDAAGGRKLPSLAVTKAFVLACDGDVAEWERRWREISADQAGPPSAEPTENSPYLGLTAFQQEDADRFFGRERLVDDLVAKLETRRFLAVFGASGAGKSSVLRAGLLPRLEQRSVLFTPGPRPARHDLDGYDVIVVDQFEEVFTLCADAAERDAFIAALLNSDAKVVIGVRADFYAHCTSHPALVAAMRDAQVPVGPMETDELRRAITRPATDAGLAVEGALLAQLVTEAHGRAGVLPLMSHALLQTWRRRRGHTLTLTAFQAAGGIDSALARTADSIYESFSPADREGVRHLFLRLTAPGDGTDDTKRRIDRAELDDDVPPALIAARLVTVDDTSVEITHESLIRSWPRLRTWLAEDRQALRTHRLLTEASAEWEANGRDPGALYRGARLAGARELDPSRFSKREQDFLDRAVAAEEDELRRSRRVVLRTRVLAGALAVLLVVACTVAVVAIGQQREAESRALAGRAAQQAKTDVKGALRDSIAAFGTSRTVEARSALLVSANRPEHHGLIEVTPATGEIALSPSGALLAVEEETDIGLWRTDGRARAGTLSAPELTGVLRIAFSSDESLVAAVSTSAVVVWDVRTRQRVLEKPVRARGAAFRLDGRALAVLTEDSTVVSWDVRSGAQVGAPVAAGQRAHTILPRPGHDVVTVEHESKATTLVDLGTGQQIGELPGRTSRVRFSPDGRTITATDGDADVVLWHADDLREVTRFAQSDVTGLAFAGTGLMLATSVGVELWDGVPLLRFGPGVQFGVSELSSGTNGIITARSGKGVVLWDLAQFPFTGPADAAWSVGFTPDGQRVRSASSRLTRTDPTRPHHRETVVTEWDPAAPTTGRRTVLRVEPGARNTIAVGPEKDVTRLAEHVELPIPDLVGTESPGDETLSADGRILASTTHLRTLLWEVRTRKPLGELPGADAGRVTALNHDGGLAVTVDGRGVRVWRTANGELVAEKPGAFEKPVAAAFGADRIVVTGTRGDVTVLDADDLDTVRSAQHDIPITAAVLSPDGRLLAASAEGRITLWDIDKGEPWATLPGQTVGPQRMAWSPDGTKLVTSDGNAVVLWTVDENLALRKACDQLHRNFGFDFDFDEECP